MEWKHGRRLRRGEVVDHRCRNTSCARPSHLEVVTPSENTRRGLKAKLSTAQAEMIRRRFAWGETQTALARIYGVDSTTVNRICRRIPRYPLHRRNASATRYRKRNNLDLFESAR